MATFTTSSAPPLGGEGESAYGDRASNINDNTGAGAGWLSGLLNSAKNRDTLLRLESGLVTFMLDMSKSRLILPPCSSFQRRICVEVAERFGLEHTLDRPAHTAANTNGSGNGNGNSTPDPSAVLLVLVKTTRSSIPAVMLSQQISSDKPKLVKRPKARGSSPAESTHGTGSAGGRPNSIKNVSQEEYEQYVSLELHHVYPFISTDSNLFYLLSAFITYRARARIFKDARNRTEIASEFTSGNSSSTDALDALPNFRVVGGGIARGPEEGKSFARRRARLNAPAADPATSAVNGGGTGIASTAIVNPTTSSVAGRIVGENGANGNGSLCTGMGELSSGNGIGNAGSILGNANSNGNGNMGSVGDRDDPDFDRCYDKWAVRGNAGVPQMMYPPQYQQHAYHGMAAMQTMPTMTHAQAHAQAAAAAVSAYPIVPMYHVSRPPPPPLPSRPLHFFPPYDTAGNAGTTRRQTMRTGPDMDIRGLHGNNAKGNVNGNPNAMRTPTYGLDSAADFPPLGSQNTNATVSNRNNNNNRSHLENQQRR